MVKKIVALVVLSSMLSGCFFGNKPIKTETQETLVTILYCPKPPETTRPDLPIHDMTPEQVADDGEVAKHYKATIKVLQGYAEELEKTLKNYDMSNEAYEKLRQE